MNIMTHQLIFDNAFAQEVATVTDTDTCNDEYDPFVLGQLDALDGNLCVPENYYAAKHQQTLYCLGWADILGENETTRWFTGTQDAIEDDYDDIRQQGLI